MPSACFIVSSPFHTNSFMREREKRMGGIHLMNKLTDWDLQAVTEVFKAPHSLILSNLQLTSRNNKAAAWWHCYYWRAGERELNSSKPKDWMMPVLRACIFRWHSRLSSFSYCGGTKYNPLSLCSVLITGIESTAWQQTELVYYEKRGKRMLDSDVFCSLWEFLVVWCMLCLTLANNVMSPVQFWFLPGKEEKQQNTGF